MGITKKDTKQKVSEDVKKLKSYLLLVGMQNGAATLENSLLGPVKDKNRATI
jgi:hypothetical protein